MIPHVRAPAFDFCGNIATTPANWLQLRERCKDNPTEANRAMCAVWFNVAIGDISDNSQCTARMKQCGIKMVDGIQRSWKGQTLEHLVFHNTADNEFARNMDSACQPQTESGNLRVNYQLTVLHPILSSIRNILDKILFLKTANTKPRTSKCLFALVYRRIRAAL